MRTKLFLLIFYTTLALSVFAQNQTKRVAILETVDQQGDVSPGVKALLRQTITFAINRTPSYDGYNRVNMAQITGEHNFQRTGMVSDDDIKKIGRMTGAAYVLIAEAVNYGPNEITIFANLIDVESGEIVNSSFPIVSKTDAESMKDACIKVARALLNIEGSSTSGSSSSSSYSYSGNSSRQNFTETVWGIDMKFVWVEGGEFLMGCTSEQSDCLDNEKNVRRVKVDGFYIGMFEVTQSQWEKVMGTSIYQQRDKASSSYSLYGVGADYPMYYVSWEEASEFCRQLSRKTGKTYVLPTEAQWEYAARGGKKADGTKYSGRNMIDLVAWYGGNSGNTTHPVGTKRENQLGIYDMSGNVFEWCSDWYSSSYANYDLNNPAGPSSDSSRVARGGGWYNDASGCRVSVRGGLPPTSHFFYLGFRVVCIP